MSQNYLFKIAFGDSKMTLSTNGKLFATLSSVIPLSF